MVIQVRPRPAPLDRTPRRAGPFRLPPVQPRHAPHVHFISGNVVACDTETTGEDPWIGHQPFFFSFCNEAGDLASFEFPVDPFSRQVDYTAGTWQVTDEATEKTHLRKDDPKAFGMLKAFFWDDAVGKEYWNAKFDVRMCERVGLPTRGKIDEIMFKAHVCNTMEFAYKLKALSNKYLGLDNEDEKELRKVVNKCRRLGKKAGWNISVDHVNELGQNEKGVVATDYWLPSACLRHGLLDPENVADAVAVVTYAQTDALRTRAMSAFYDEVMANEGVRHSYDEEMELWPTVYEMETRGILVNLDAVDAEIANQKAIIAEYYPKLMAFTADCPGGGFDPDKPACMKWLLYEKLKLPVKHVTKKKEEPATHFKAIESYADNPCIRALLKWRNAVKGLQFFNNYRKGAIDDVVTDCTTKVLHPSFQQVGPVTGRFSCRKPNIQNVPDPTTTRSFDPVQGRRPFGPRPGWRWYHVDYHQLEALIFADVAQEQTMLAAIADGRDLHTECTNKAWGGKGNPAAIVTAMHALEIDGTGERSNKDVIRACEDLGLKGDVLKYPASVRQAAAEKWLSRFDYSIVKAEKSIGKKNSRAKAKMVLFLKVFGGGADALKDLLRSSREEAVQFLKDYDIAFPTIVRYIKSLSKQALRDGHIINRYNRRLNVHPDFSYRAVNYMVQGSAASQMKRAMVRLAAWFKQLRRTHGIEIHIVMTIHDELVFEIRHEQSYLWLLRGICEMMADHEGHFGIDTPVEMSMTDTNWSEKRPVVWEFLNTKDKAETINYKPDDEKFVREEDGLTLVLDGHDANHGKWVRVVLPSKKLTIKKGK